MALVILLRAVVVTIAAMLVLSGCGAPAGDRESMTGATDAETTASAPAPAPSGPGRPRHRVGHEPTSPTSYPGVPLKALPVHALTPGIVLTTSARTVCVSGYSAGVRDVSSSRGDAVYERYDVVHVPYAHEVDHLISLELGGSNKLRNLWPQPYAGRWGARTKDVLESRLHALVCDHRLSLARAQHMEARDWVGAYRRYVGVPPKPAPASPPAPAAPASPPASPPASGRGCAPGYSLCLPRAADLNCDDLSAGQAPVRVTGSDPYGLDADGDGLGCTS